MIKLVLAVRRRPEVCREQFEIFWRASHDARATDAAEKLGTARFQQHTTLLSSAFSRCPAYDGLAELCWNSEYEMRTKCESTNGQESLAQIVHNNEIIDAHGTLAWIVEEPWSRQQPVGQWPPTVVQLLHELDITGF
jgi:hypothetical protein